MQILLPIFAPNALGNPTLIPMKGFQEALTNRALTKYHAVILIRLAPLLNEPVEKSARRTF